MAIGKGFDFTRIIRWERNDHSELGQSIIGDALFLRSPKKFFFQKSIFK